MFGSLRCGAFPFSILSLLPYRGRQDADRPTHRRHRPNRRLLCKSELGIRQSLLNFIGPDLVAVHWKHWPVYFTDIYPTGTGRQRQPTLFVVSAPMAGYPKLFNIEMDPHEDLDVARLFAWVGAPSLKTVEEYKETLKKFPNPPVDKVKKF